MTLIPCSLAKASKSGMRDMVPSAFISSVITPAGYRPARIARSTAASVWPARVSTPPSAARSGKVWPGIEKSEAVADGSRTVRSVAARSCADAPVVVASLASMLTLKAVPSRLVLRSTMGAMPSSSSRPAMTGMHTRPDPWRVMKLMCSGVTSCAETTRSPSFSRSSSSTTMTNLPASKSAIASGTVASVIALGMLPAQVSGHVPGDDLGFDIDDRPSFVLMGDRHFDGVRDQRDSERAGGLVYRHHREAHAVNRDRSFDGDIPRDGGGGGDRQPPA